MAAGRSAHVQRRLAAGSLAARIVLLLMAAAVREAAAAGDAAPPLRRPLNAECPSHSYPFNVREFGELVGTHPLFQPGVAQEAAARDAAAFARQVTDFTYAASEYAVQYVKRVGHLNDQRPFKFNMQCGSPKFSGILSGQPRATPAKIVWASRFSFETPLLLYRLHTYKDLVEYQFLAESTRLAHSGTLKPLVLDRVKGHLIEFLHQIVHLVLDDTHLPHLFSWGGAALGTATSTKDEWGNEAQHHSAIYAAIPERFKELGDSDIVVYGDMDEMADEDLLFHLKHCELNAGVTMPVLSNAVMWYNDYRHIFRTDHSPGPAYPYSLKFPAIWTMGHIRANSQPGKPLELRGSGSGSVPSVPGGYHMTMHLFAPSLYLKLAGIAEAGMARMASSPHIRNVHAFVASHRTVTYIEAYRKRIVHPDCLMQRYPAYKNVTLMLPWLMVQNVQAFAFFIPCQPAFYDLDPKFKDC